MNKPFRLIASQGTGSALTEAVLQFKSLPYELDEIDYEKVLAKDPKIKNLNPISQLPTLILPDGSVMTESAAIAFYLEDVRKEPGLFLDPTHPDKAQLLRWFLFISATIYPTFTYGDIPSRWVHAEEAQEQLKTSTDEHRKNLWKILESTASAQVPYFYGDDVTILDIHVAVMSYWRPRREWFKTNCEKLYRIAKNTESHPRLQAVFTRNFT